MGESGSEVFDLIIETGNFSEVTISSSYTSKHWLKATLREINNLINNNNFLVYEPEKGYPVNPCMDVHKENIQYDGSLDKLKLIIVVKGDLQNKYLIGDTW